jgi:hypothetical protein
MARTAKSRSAVDRAYWARSLRASAKAFARLAHLDDTRLLTIDRQPEASFQQPFDPVNQLPGLVARQNDKVIRVAHELGVGPRAGSVVAAVLLLEPMQVDIGQQWRDNPTLWRSLLGP